MTLPCQLQSDMTPWLLLVGSRFHFSIHIPTPSYVLRLWWSIFKRGGCMPPVKSNTLILREGRVFFCCPLFLKSFNPAFSFRYTIGISSNSDNDPYQFRNLDFWKCLFTACLFKVWLATTSYRYADSVVLRRRKKGPCTLRTVLNRSWRRGWQCRTKYAAAWLTPVGRKACHVVEQRCSRRSLRWLMSNNSTWSWPIQSARLNHGGINFHCHISC